MRKLAATLDRLRNSLSARADQAGPEFRVEFQIVADERAGGSPAVDDLEALADRVGEFLEHRTHDLALGPVVGYKPDEQEVEVEFTVDADSAAEFHKRVARIMSLLERECLRQYGDSTLAPWSVREPAPSSARTARGGRRSAASLPPLSPRGWRPRATRATLARPTRFGLRAREPHRG